AITITSACSSSEMQELASWAANEAFKESSGRHPDQIAFLKCDSGSDRSLKGGLLKNHFELRISAKDRFRDFLHYREMYRMKCGI
ncbi:MAG: hypothetical protein ACTSRU_19345, partial [Candidatus Hodarchaeales archaeon]